LAKSFDVKTLNLKPVFKETLTMTWTIDPSHTRANFTARHMMIANVHGTFDNVTGVVDFNEADPTRSTIDVMIAADSLHTRDEKRDSHLKSPDFLDVANHPYLTFKSTRAEKTGETTGRVTGDLTIRGATRPVVLDVEYNGQAKSPWGTISAGFTATTKINRKDWSLNWNVALETGGWLVGKEIEIDIELELVQVAEPVAELVPA
jgi:polyisoprenoid-binding protein YceI